MSRKVYKTAQGKSIDLGALQLQNESIRAVGNMGVNARGDKIDADNKIIKGRNQLVAKQYKKQVNRNNVSDDVVIPSKKHALEQTKQTSPPASKKSPAPEVAQDVLQFEEETVATVATVEETKIIEPVAKETKKPVSGLAGAIAKAKNVKQEVLKTPRQIAQEKKGVNKI